MSLISTATVFRNNFNRIKVDICNFIIDICHVWIIMLLWSLDWWLVRVSTSRTLLPTQPLWVLGHFLQKQTNANTQHCMEIGLLLVHHCDRLYCVRLANWSQQGVVLEPVFAQQQLVEVAQQSRVGREEDWRGGARHLKGPVPWLPLEVTVSMMETSVAPHRWDETPGNSISCKASHDSRENLILCLLMCKQLMLWKHLWKFGNCIMQKKTQKQLTPIKNLYTFLRASPK